MIARVVDNVLSSNARPVLVVTGHQAEQVQHALGGRPVRYVHAADYAEGLSASLKAGIAAVPEECAAALVCLGDMPLVTGRMIDRLLSSYDPDEGRLIVLPTFRGKQGNPMLWDRRFFAGDPADHRRFRRALPARQAYRGGGRGGDGGRCGAARLRHHRIAGHPAAAAAARADRLTPCRSARPIPGGSSISRMSTARRTSASRPRIRTSWEWYPRHRWIYDKLAVALSQGLQAAPHGVMPPSFPVFSKPIMNLRGMGTGSQAIAFRRGISRGADRRALLVHAADRPACQHRRGPGGRRAALVASHHRRHRARRHVRPLAGPCRSDAGDRGLVRRLGAQAPARLHRDGEFRDDRRPHHRGASALRRPMA